MKNFTSASCCKEADGLVFWHYKGPANKLHGGRRNPPKTGWTMSVDDISLVPVNYCPFCGIKLSTLMEDNNAQRTE